MLASQQAALQEVPRAGGVCGEVGQWSVPSMHEEGLRLECHAGGRGEASTSQLLELADLESALR